MDRMGARGAVRIESSGDAAEVLRRAGAFLWSRPVEHNLVLTLLEERAAHPQPGRFWSVLDGDDVIGVLFQSPLDFHATITPVASYALPALVAKAAAVAPDLPGITGEAATAALFAGCWAEICKVAAGPDEGERLYELGVLTRPNGVVGRAAASEPRRQGRDHLVVGPVRGRNRHARGSAQTMRRRIASGLVWIWHDDGPVAIPAFTPAIAGVSWIGAVFTPDEHRRRGSARPPAPPW